MSYWHVNHWRTPGVTAPVLVADRVSPTAMEVLCQQEGRGHWHPASFKTGWLYQIRLRYRFEADEHQAVVPANTWALFSNLRPGAEYLVWAVGRNGSYYTAPEFLPVSLAELDSVLAAIKRGFSMSATAQHALPGGLWASEIPEDVELPYGSVECRGSRYEWTTEDFHLEIASIRMCVFAVGAEACERAVRNLRAAFDWQELPFSQDAGMSSTCQMMPTDYTVQSEFAKLGDGSVVYQGMIEYELSINRNDPTGG